MATIRVDPTQTMAIEKRWLREIDRRWSLFTSSVLKPVNDDLRLNALDADQSQVRIYMEFLNREIDRLLLVTRQAPNWQAVYQLQAYERSIERFRASIRQQGVDLSLTIEEFQKASILTPALFTATPSLGVAVLTPSVLASNPIHLESIEHIFTRSYESLKGHTDKMAREIREILTQGIRQGTGTRDISRQIRNRIGVSKSSAERIARTEVTGAYRISQINQARITGEELGEDVNLRWLTRRDRKVRDLHAHWHGKVMTPDDADKNTNISPFNCRCSLQPVIDEADTPVKQAKFDKQKAELLALTA